MRDFCPMSPHIPRGPIEAEFRKLFRQNDGIAAADRLWLPELRRVLVEKQAFDPAGEATFAAALRDYVCELLPSVTALPAYQAGLRANLAIDPVEPATTNHKERTRQSAIKADVTLDAWQHDRRIPPRLSARTLVLRQLIAKIDPADAVEPPNGSDGTDQSGISPSPTRPAAYDHIADLYQSVIEDDLDEGFWWRTSTRQYVRQLAGPGDLTIYAGADGDADVGPPLHKSLLRSTLVAAAASDPLLATIPKAHRHDTFTRVIRFLMDSLPSSYIGSMIRGVYQTDRDYDFFDTERTLHNVLYPATRSTPGAKGFVASPIIDLAIASAAAGRTTSIISARYDNNIERASSRAENTPFEFRFHANTWPLQHGVSIPVIALNGSARHDPARDDDPPGPLVLGEIDLLAPDFSSRTDRADYQSRAPVIKRALAESQTIFIGTSLSDPCLVSVLAATKHYRLPRYALLLAPTSLRPIHLEPSTDWRPVEHDDDLVDPASTVDQHTQDFSLDERRLALELLSRRYLHLGVVPIWADFEHQVPQLLREVALCIQQPAEYQDYRKRIKAWWTGFSDAFGYNTQGVPIEDSVRRESWQAAWHEALRDDIVVSIIQNGHQIGTTSKERVMVEVWIRNAAARELFFWASSEGIWRRSGTAPSASLREWGTITQRTFREGQTLHSI